MKKKVRWCIIIVGIVFFGYHLVLNPWSKIECEEWEINIRTGHERYTKYVFFIPIDRKISENWVSKNLKRSPEAESEWRVVGTSSSRAAHSPHYTFHSAISDVGYLTLTEEFGETPDEVFQKIAQNTVKLWQLVDHDSEAGYYLRDIDILTREKESKAITINEVPDLLPWMKERLKQMEKDYSDSKYAERYRGFIRILEAEPGGSINSVRSAHSVDTP